MPKSLLNAGFSVSLTLFRLCSSLASFTRWPDNGGCPQRPELPSSSQHALLNTGSSHRRLPQCQSCHLLTLLRDYQSLLKPALLATADNGVLICCNNLAKVSMEDWREQVLRCAEKAGRPVRDCKVMTPGADFPSQDQQPPLKTLILQL